MLTIAELLQALDGLDLDAPVIVGIINGPRFDAAYANPEAGRDAPHLYICCYEDPRPWEGPRPVVQGDGTAILRYEPGGGAGADSSAEPPASARARPQPRRSLLAAAQALLAARADGQVTAAEWQALEDAVAAARGDSPG